MKKIFLILCIFYLCGCTTNHSQDSDKNLEWDKTNMLFDAKGFISSARLQFALDKANAELDNDSSYTNNCYYIYGKSDDNIYKNAGNYVGSVLVDGDNTKIWLSDGNYMVQGTYDDLEIFESSLTASKNCNR